MTSVGYGDLEIKYRSTRVFGIFFIIICVCLYAAIVNNIFTIVAEANELPPKPFELDDQEWTDILGRLFPEDSIGSRTISKERLCMDIILKKHVIDFNFQIYPMPGMTY